MQSSEPLYVFVSIDTGELTIRNAPTCTAQHALMDSVAARAAGMDVVCGIADLGPSQSDCSVHSSLAASDADSWPQEQCTWILMEHCSGCVVVCCVSCVRGQAHVLLLECVVADGRASWLSTWFCNCVHNWLCR